MNTKDIILTIVVGVVVIGTAILVELRERRKFKSYKNKNERDNLETFYNQL